MAPDTAPILSDAEAGEAAQSKFSPEEEAELVAESNAQKADANALFTSGSYDAAINKYDEAIAVCPTYLDYELAVLKSNIAACHLKLEEWKEAVNYTTAALDGLERLEAEESAEEKGNTTTGVSGKTSPSGVPGSDDDDEGVEEEIVSAGASKAAVAPKEPASDAEIARKKRQEDIARIRAKALMRRGRARSELGGWSNLEGAIEDYKKLSAMENLSASDRKLVLVQLRNLPPRAKAAQEKETAEMWGKLKDLGNGILKPFGLSTDSFQMVKDEKTGGYSMNFQGGGGGEGGK